ncbi:MAG: hypothetical protein A3K18_15585 [Lentisphaerae bacterium RIFOXYA12_64_32]|nr:MAG: hypothetical protein A3K18_15585 [Lentisphaerae bacterium RIFOXYA12_64_32]
MTLLILSMSLVYFFSFFQRVAVPGTVFNEIQHDMGLSAAAVTALGSMFFYIYASMQLVVGIAADRFGGRRTLLTGGVLMALGALAFPLSHSPEMLYLSRALTGLGASFMYLSTIKEVDALVAPRHFTTVLGSVFFIGYAGGVAGTLPFERVSAAVGWRPALFGAAVLTFVALFFCAVVVRGVPLHRRPPVSGHVLAPYLRVLRNRRNWPLFVNGAINFSVYFVIQTVLGKKFLQDVAGLSSAAAASFTLAMMVVCALAVFSGGPLLRLTRNRRKPPIVATTLVLVAATSLLCLGVVCRASGWVFLVCYIMLPLIGLASAAGVATVKELNDPNAVAQSVAMHNFAAYVAVAILANAAGLVLDSYRSVAVVTAAGATVYPAAAYTVVFAALLVLCLISVGAALLVTETRGQPVLASPFGSAGEPT